MDTRFKIGDKVRVVRTGKVGWESEDWCQHAYREARLAYPSDIAIISKLHDSNLSINGSGLIICAEHFELVDQYKAIKQKPSKFVLQYGNAKQTEYFGSLPEVKTRVKELAGSADFKRDNIFLHTLAKTQKIELGTSITIRKI